MNKLHLLFILVSIGIFAACGGTDTPQNAVNTTNGANAANANTANVDSPLAVTTPTPAARTNDAPTVGPVFKAYCAAVEKKDEATLRKIYAAETLKDFQQTMNEDGIDSLAEFLAGDGASSALCEVRNEEITGDTAVAEAKTKGMPNGAKIVFIREGGAWKLTNRVPGFEKK